MSPAATMAPPTYQERPNSLSVPTTPMKEVRAYPDHISAETDAWHAQQQFEALRVQGGGIPRTPIPSTRLPSSSNLLSGQATPTERKPMPPARAGGMSPLPAPRPASGSYAPVQPPTLPPLLPPPVPLPPSTPPKSLPPPLPATAAAATKPLRPMTVRPLPHRASLFALCSLPLTPFCCSRPRCHCPRCCRRRA